MSSHDETWRKKACKRSSRDESSMHEQFLQDMGEMNATQAGQLSSWDPRMKTLVPYIENFIIPG